MHVLHAVDTILQMLHVKVIPISGVLRSRANLTSWRERASMRKGHKVKQIMCLQYQAVIRCFSAVVLLFVCFKFSNGPFHYHYQFPRSAVLSVPVTVQGKAKITVAKGTSARL